MEKFQTKNHEKKIQEEMFKNGINNASKWKKNQNQEAKNREKKLRTNKEEVQK